MTTAADLSHRIAFDRREDVNPDAPNDYGNTQSLYIQQFVVWAAVKAKMGGEAVTAARLTGQQPVLITVRQSANTDQIKTDWRARDVRTGTEYNIRSIADPDDGGRWLELLCQTGVAS